MGVNTEVLRQSLRDLVAQQKPKKSKVKQVEALLPEIEECFDLGFTYAQVAEKLRDSGLEVSGPHLSVLVTRARRSARQTDPVSYVEESVSVCPMPEKY